MNHDWQKMTVDLTGAIKDLRAGAPNVIKSSSALAQAATHANALDTKTKEFIALAIAVATRCDGCIAFHAQAAAELGASMDEVMETVEMAIYMGASPSVIYAAQAVEAYNQFKNPTGAGIV